ncbi:antitoxin [Patescibacteria group bacterium]|nr:antitoxin [Patescibacteria group bacterium]MBU1472368.1 antitoxin [Patescibacteria group bacterium]MBU2459895.1 antitoxin [Patescibacteria group bacterium]MBU2544734.1 antitoxin [Patescibacteria group bacterium]
MSKTQVRNPFKNLKLDPEERELLRSVEAGEWKPVKNFAAQKKRFHAAARATLDKIRNINIRLTERDIHRLKSKAIEEGIPYQTLVASILHKYAA